jgi:methionyl-tRNA formyltransferase
MKIVFMGTPQAAVPTLERILADGHEVVGVYTQPDRPSGRGNRVAFSPVKQCAIERNIPILQPHKIRTDESIDQFRSLRADIAVVVAYGRILPEAFITAFPLGAVNVHFSLLPKYRGAAPVNWAIVNGETETGVTTMRMDAGLDTGDILLQRSTAILANETSIELMERLAILGADLLAETLSDLDKIEPRKQDHDLATSAPLLRKEDGIIDWNLSANEIANRVRGFQPFPTAFTYYQGMKLTIWAAETAVLDSVEQTTPGQIVKAKGDDLIVSCGDNSALGVTDLQLEGRRRLATRDFLNGISIREGEILGSKNE